MAGEKGKAKKRKPTQSARSIKSAKELRVVEFEEALKRAMDILSPRTQVNSMLEGLYQLHRYWLDKLQSCSSKKGKAEATARIKEYEEEISHFEQTHYDKRD